MVNAAESRQQETEKLRLKTMEHARGLAGKVDALNAELARLRPVVEQLHKTADGVYVVPWMTLFCPLGHKAHNHHNRCYCTAGDCWADGCQSDSGGGTHYDYEKCYSSKEAALSPSPTPPADRPHGGWPVSDCVCFEPANAADPDCPIHGIKVPTPPPAADSGPAQTDCPHGEDGLCPPQAGDLADVIADKLRERGAVYDRFIISLDDIIRPLIPSTETTPSAGDAGRIAEELSAIFCITEPDSPGFQVNKDYLTFVIRPMLSPPGVSAETANTKEKHK